MPGKEPFKDIKCGEVDYRIPCGTSMLRERNTAAYTHSIKGGGGWHDILNTNKKVALFNLRRRGGTFKPVV